MSAPNLVTPTTINFKSSAVALVSGGVNILVNASASGFAYKVDLIQISNVHTSATNVSIMLAKNGTSVTMFSGSVSGNAVFQFPGPYMEENDTISGTAVDNSRVNVVASYQLVS